MKLFSTFALCLAANEYGIAERNETELVGKHNSQNTRLRSHKIRYDGSGTRLETTGVRCG